MRRSCLSIKVELRLGSSIEDACSDAIELANKLMVTVRFKFNNLTCLIHHDSNIVNLMAKYKIVLSSKNQYKILTD